VLLDLVAQGLGIALVPRTFACQRISTDAPRRIGISTLKKPALPWDLVAALNGREGAAQARNPAVAAFTKLLDKIRTDVVTA